MSVRLDRASVTVGERLHLTIDVVSAPHVQIQMPGLAIGKDFGGMEVLESHTPPDVPDQGNRRTTHQYVLRTFDAGAHELPAINLHFSEPDASDVSELSSPALTVEVRSMLEGEFDPTDYRDIKEAVAISTPWNAATWWAIVGGCAAFAAAIALIMLLRRRYLNSQAAPPLPPHIWAIQQLDLLASDRLLERSDFHQYFFRLSGIVRQYIERQFAIMAAEQTTDEFLREARRSPQLLDSQRSLLSDFLRQADMVKFAKFQPTRTESDAALEAARRFVEETTVHMGELATSAHGEPDMQIRSPHTSKQEVGV